MNESLNDWLDKETEEPPAFGIDSVTIDAIPVVAARIRERVSTAISIEQLATFSSLRIAVPDSGSGLLSRLFSMNSRGGAATTRIVISGTRHGVPFEDSVCGRAIFRSLGGNVSSMEELALANAIEETATVLQERVGASHPYTRTAKTIRFVCWTVTALVILFVSLSLYRIYVSHPVKPTPSRVAKLMLYSGIAFSAVGTFMIMALAEPLFAPRDWLLNHGKGRRWFIRAGMPDSQNVVLLKLISAIIVLVGFYIMRIQFGLIFQDS